MRRLPPLAALRAFEAAARHLSFKRASEELGVTPTAISHQVRLLEETIGRRLFDRRTRQVIMTAEAQVLFPVLRDGFDAFVEALASVAGSPNRDAVTLTATRAFTARWLIPRVSRFHEARPDISLRLLARDEIVDLANGDADLAIRSGGVDAAGLRAESLVVDRFAPVAHPSLRMTSVEDLARATLIHFEWQVPRLDRPVWAGWLRAAGIAGVDASAGLRFSDESHAIQAVAAGHGVGLLSLVLVADDLAAGTLVQPFGPELEGAPWRLVRAIGRQDDEAVTAVRDWVVAEMKA